MKLYLFLFGFLLELVVYADKVDYTGYKVIEVIAESQDHLNVLHNLEKDNDNIQYWNDPGRRGNRFQLRLNGADSEEALQLFFNVGMKSSVVVEDVQKLIDEADKKMHTRKLRYRGVTFDFYNFHPYSEIVDFVQQLSTQGTIFTSSVIGTTHEGRDIVMGQISTGSDPNKPVIVLECGIHAREWISPASCIWMMNELVAQYGTDPEVTSLVDAFDFHVIPVMNPDGYQYTWDSDRLWRKNRAVNSGSVCRGVDNNRNFDANFGGVGSSSSPCSETYHGVSAFSEPESQAVRQVLQDLGSRTKAFVSIHSHASLWMSPYGYTSAKPTEYDEMYRVMSAGVAALEATHGTQFVFGDESSILYLTSGTTRDYAYVAHGIVYSFTIELRDKLYGFVAPPEEILPTAEETWNGLKAMANAILNP